MENNNLKYVYLIDQPTIINPITKFYDRLEKLHYEKVNSLAEKIDVIVVDNNVARSEKDQAKLDKRIIKLKKKFSPKILSLKDFLNLIGYEPDPQFVLWTDQYPNFNPWTGEPVRMWRD
ncbi:hypothetical protein R5Q06_00715 [Oenococcus oeni]|uniref:hypothetical protein n=1 Tax=Oenococcus oeni TaxID=1247 RepID=UPI0008F8BA4E|nr:hypothetical protein [Oenococcus oeni]OIL96385.1 hypothetical protein ATX47_02315 [Oenococcus oeni]PDH84418.1 hypothetical protein AO462_05385 [Oenococcus oeni]